MTNEKRAFSNEQFKEFIRNNPEMQLHTYNFPENDGVFAGVLVAKKWGHISNIIGYVDLDDGRKIMCSAYSNKEYLGLPEVAIGERVRLTFKKARTGRNNLVNVERVL